MSSPLDGNGVLEPCRKCEAHEGAVGVDGGWFTAECQNCDHRTGAYRSAAEAIAAWNRPSQTAVEPVWTGPGKEPHEYHPDVAAMGDCSVCGHTYAAHRSSVEPVAELDSLAKLVNYLLGYSGQHDDVDDGFAKLRATLSKEAAARVAAEERAVAAERLTAKSYDKVVEFSARAEALQTRVAELEAAGNQIEPYLAFAIGPESPGYHPTMPSAVASFRATLARRLTHQEKNNG